MKLTEFAVRAWAPFLLLLDERKAFEQGWKKGPAKRADERKLRNRGMAQLSAAHAF